MSKSGFLAEPVLIGRERELEGLQQYVDLALQGKGTTVFISGEAGSGKTRLVTEFLSSTRQKREITELSGWCLSNSGVPYFPFIEALMLILLASARNRTPKTRALVEPLQLWRLGKKS